MFGFLKKKVQEAVKSISEKITGKEEKEQPVSKPAHANNSEPRGIVGSRAPAHKAGKNEKQEKPKAAKKQEKHEHIKAPEKKHERAEAAEEKIEDAESPKAEQKKPGFAERLKMAVTETKLSSDAVDSALFDLELALLENNVAEVVSRKIVSDIRAKLVGASVKRGDVEKIIGDSLKKSVLEILGGQPKVDLKKLLSEKKPATIMFFGFNGSGKTTSIAKLANYLLKNKYSVVLAAGDSFRAAAIEQLAKHAERLKVPIIKHQYGADPAAVIFDARKHAEARGIDAVLADTAGRVHTDANLVRELEKIVRVNKPDLKILVVESIAGNDVVEQAKVFEAVGIDGIILTKWDVDEKGGAALSLCYTLKKPILFLGTGQEYGDFEEFDAKKAVENIV